MLSNLLLVDRLVLPQHLENDNIAYYSKIKYTAKSKFGRSHARVAGYKFTTRKGNEFALECSTFPFPDDRVRIGLSPVCRMVTSVVVDQDDYSARLMSGLNGVGLFFYILLSVSSLTGFYIFAFRTQISEDTMYNVILSIAFFLVVIAIIYNVT